MASTCRRSSASRLGRWPLKSSATHGLQSIVADVAIARLVDRIIHRRRARRTDAPGEAESRARVNLPEPTDETQTQQLLPPQPESPKQELRR